MSARTLKVILNDGEETKKIKLAKPDIASVKQELCRRLNLESNMSLVAILVDDSVEYSITTSDDLADNWDNIKELNVTGKQKDTTAIRSISVVLNNDEKKIMAFETRDFVKIKTAICNRFDIEEGFVTISGSIKGDLYAISDGADVEQLWTSLEQLHISGKKKRMQVDLVVAIKNEAYNVDKIPQTSSLVVQDAYRDLEVIDDIEQVNRSLRRVGAIANMSYFAAVAIGNKELSVRTKEFGFDIIRLCHAADNTLKRYFLTSRLVIQTFNTAIIYLLENDYARALIMISTLEATAQDCVHHTENLNGTVIDEVSKSEMLSEMTITKELLEREEAKTFKKEQRQKESECMYDASEIIASGAIEKKIGWQMFTTGVAAAAQIVGRVDTSSMPRFFISAGAVLLGNSAAKYEENEEEKEEQEQKRQEKKRRQMAEEATLKMDLNDLKKGIKEAENSEKCMHILNGELFKIRVDLENMKSFFLGLKLFCNVIKKSENGIIECMTVESSEASGGKKVDCRQLFHSDVFKQQLVSYQATWVALQNVCLECRETLKITKKELQEHIEQNPTKQEAGEQIYAMIEKV